ncbi:MAG: cupin domain-containing protein [Alphaproteobacteria bacterium]|nr:cupin domain-containing protein [Alphaproteobacteria bacterium]
MNTARHARPAELEGVSLEEIMARYVGRFQDKVPDWNAFADASIEGNRRAQHRFIGAGASGKHGDASAIPAGAFTLSIMLVPPGQGNAPHTHEVEEVFFVLQGRLTAFVEDESGRRVSKVLEPWEMICCPAGVIHGYVNDTEEPCYLQVMLGRGKPETAGFADQKLFEQRDRHLG